MFSRLFMTIAAGGIVCAGCGGGIDQFPTAHVTGVVTCEGQPVPNVRVLFLPKSSGKSAISGKSGMGTTSADGTFTISTYGTEDGAVVGEHDVAVNSPHPERFPDFNCDCETDSRRTVLNATVVEEGDNHFAIVLPKKSTKRRRPVEDEDLDDLEEEE